MSDVTIRISAVDNASATLHNVARSLEGVSVAAGKDATSGAAAAMNRLGQAATTAFVGFATARMGQAILDMRDLGQTARNAELAFTQLAGGTQGATAMLAQMRAATGGVVADVNLMAGANRLLLMELARNGDEAARLTEIAVTLGRVMGKDASQAIEDFSLLLSNRSIPRLDNFGISAARVRERVEELKEAGYGIEDAFTTAVLEEGARSMERLGSAVSTSLSAWDLLGAKVENVKKQLAGVVFQAGEALAQLILIASYIPQIPAADNTANTNERTQAALGTARSTYDIAAQNITQRFRPEQIGMYDIEKVTEAITRFQGGGYASLEEAGRAAGLSTSMQFRMLEQAYMGEGYMPTDSLRSRMMAQVNDPGARGATGRTAPATGAGGPELVRLQEQQAAQRRSQQLQSQRELQAMYGGAGAVSPEMRMLSAALSSQMSADERRQWVEMQHAYGAGGVGGWYGMQAGETGTATGEARASAILRQMASAQVAQGQTADYSRGMYGALADQRQYASRGLLSGRDRQQWVGFQNEYGAGGIGGWYGMQSGETGTATGAARAAAIMRQMASAQLEQGRAQDYSRSMYGALGEWRMRDPAAARRRRVDFQREWGAEGVGGWYGMQSGETGTAAGREQAEGVKAAWDWLSGTVSTIGSGVSEALGDAGQAMVGYAWDTAKALDEAAAAAARIPATLTEWLAKGKPTGIGGEFLSEVGRQMKDISESDTMAQEFLRETGMVSWRDDLITMIASMPVEQAVPIATRMQGVLDAGGQDYTSIAEAMGAAGYYQTTAGGGRGAATRYTVKPGDTISGLAAQFGLSQDALMARFGISDPRRLQAGATLEIGGGGGGEWQQYDTTMTGSMLAEGAGMGGGGTGMFDAALSQADELEGRVAAIGEEIETPRTMPVILDVTADLSKLDPMVRSIVMSMDLGRTAPVGTGGGKNRNTNVPGFGPG
jgi:hypothetical protein